MVRNILYSTAILSLYSAYNPENNFFLAGLNIYIILTKMPQKKK